MRPEEAHDDAFENLLKYLKSVRGFDFTGYKRSSLRRRIRARMQSIGVEEFDDYVDYLEVHPDEFPLLFNTILINVTAFFRDETAWEYLRQEIVPKLLATKKPGEPLRCWSTGCASGEEPYTLAMILAETLGAAEFGQRVKIYATDVDEEALAQARRAVYTAKDIQTVPESYRAKYFEPQNNHYALRGEIRRPVIFGRHDLVQDAPISRVDLLVARNTLMYFNAETQTRILSRLHFALNPGGYMFLGRAEMLVERAGLFAPVNVKCRIFAKVPSSLRPNHLAPGRIDTGAAAEAEAAEPMRSLQAALPDALPVACLVVDVPGNLALANRRARELFGVRAEDLGRPFQDLEVSYHPVELRSLIGRVLATGSPAGVERIQWKSAPDGDAVIFDVRVTPLPGPGNPSVGVIVTFLEMTNYYRLRDEIETTRAELAATNEELHSANEELETTNEELQSTVEELQTTNEELQSTNEEMETMNEELQATNEELQTTNEQLHERTEELDLANAFKESIFRGIRTGVVVIDRNFIVRSWNRKAEDLWGIREDEAANQSFFSLDVGLPVEDLRDLVRALLAGETAGQEVTLPSTNRRGRKFHCRVTCTTLVNTRGQIQGVILLMEEWKTQPEIKEERS